MITASLAGEVRVRAEGSIKSCAPQISFQEAATYLRHSLSLLREHLRKEFKMVYFYIFLAVAAGVALSAQIGINNSLRISLNSSVFAAFFSFAIGTAGLLVYAIATRSTWPSMQILLKVPAWAWLGGLLGAYYVITAILVAPKLGAASLISLIVAAQICTSLLLDHFGLLGFSQHSINIWRIAGALLLIVGAIVIVKN
jgi:transporter family-2 protein